jgi:hypothetical protein
MTVQIFQGFGFGVYSVVKNTTGAEFRRLRFSFQSSPIGLALQASGRAM